MSQKKILSGITFSWVRFVFGFVVNILMTPLYFRYLEKEMVGVWFLFSSAAAFLRMSNFGLPSAVSRAIAFIRKGNSHSLQPEVEFYNKFSITDIYKSAFRSFILIALFVVVIGSFLIIIIKPNFGLTSSSSTMLTYAFVVFLVGVFFYMTAEIPNACLNGLGDVGYDNLFRIFIQLFGLLCTFIFLPFFQSILTLSLVYVAQGILSTLIVNWFIRIKHKNIFATTGKLNKNLIIQLYKESTPLFVNQIGGWLTNQSGIWIATYTIGVSLIADYSVLNQLIVYGLSISMSIPLAVNPYATTAFSEGGVKNVHKYFFLTLKAASYIAGFWFVTVFIWGKEILDIWIGSGHFLGYYVLIPLLINMFFELQHSVSGGFVWNTGKWPFVPATLAAGILNVVFSFIGSQIWGFAGLAIGTMLSKLFTLNWYVVYYALKRLEIKFTSYVKKHLIRLVLIIVFFTAISFLLKKQLLINTELISDFDFSKNKIVVTVFGTTVIFVLWSTATYYFLLNHNEKMLLRTLGSKFFRYFIAIRKQTKN